MMVIMTVCAECSDANVIMLHLNSVAMMEPYQYHHSYSFSSCTCRYLRTICSSSPHSPVCLCPACLGLWCSCTDVVFLSLPVLLWDLRVCRTMEHSLCSSVSQHSRLEYIIPLEYIVLWLVCFSKNFFPYQFILLSVRAQCEHINICEYFYAYLEELRNGQD